VLAAARDAAATPGPVTRLLTVFSDGQTTTSTRPADVVPDLTALGVSVFPVALGHRQIVDDMRAVQESGYDARGQLTPGARGRMLNLEDRDRRVREFASLAALTGGRSFDPPDVSLGTVRTILAMLTATVVAEYVVGFVPVVSGGAPRAHKLEIRLRSKESGSVIGGKRTAVY
jgi:hypothetical protein